MPQPAGQPDVAEVAWVGPAYRTQANAYDVGISRERDRFVIGKKAELFGLALAVMEDNGTLPASLLVVVEFAEIGDDLLARPGVGAHALDQGIVGMLLAVFGLVVASEKHGQLLFP